MATRKTPELLWREDRKCFSFWFYDAADVRRQKNVPAEHRTKTAARRWMLDFLPEQDTAQARPKRSALTVAPLFDKWIEQREAEMRRPKPRVMPSTVATNKGHGTKWIKPLLGALPVTGIDTPEVRAWLRKLRDAGSEPQTVRNIYYTFVAFLDDVIGDGWVKLSTNPARSPGIDKELPAQPDRSGGARVVAQELRDVQAVIDCEAVPLYRRAKYALVYTSALRASEVQGLRWRDVDMQLGILDIQKAFSPGAKDGGWVELRGPKRGSVRLLPLHPAARDALAEWRALWSEATGRDITPDAPVFAGPNGEHTRPKFAKELRADLKTAGRPEATPEGKPITFHSSRRSLSTWLDGVEIAEGTIQRILGHADRNVTRKHYTGRDIELMRSALLRAIPLSWRSKVHPPPAPGVHVGSDGGTELGRSAGESNPPSAASPPRSSGFEKQGGKRSQALAPLQARDTAREGTGSDDRGRSRPGCKSRAKGGAGAAVTELPAALVRGLERTSPRTREGVLVRRLAKATESLQRGDIRTTRAELRRAERSWGGRP